LLREASLHYRERFTPSEQLSRPHLMLGLHVCAADTDRAARDCFSSIEQAFINLRLGRPSPLPPPRPGFRDSLAPAERLLLEQTLACSVVGSPETIQRGLREFAERTAADELIVTSMIYDHAARLRSYQLTAEARDVLGAG
jgi:alkanesulfonate monooxygenase SsuD/methylene tetrahydromethanopterin reductase-like flavin-dependent oxidoreductase (luciferase family)